MSKENIVSYSIGEVRERLARGESRSDWARVDATTDEEIEAQMRDDPDWADFIDVDWSRRRSSIRSPRTPSRGSGGT